MEAINPHKTKIMKKIILLLMIFTLVYSCSDDDNGETDCSVVFCFGGDIVKLTLFQNGQNIFETEPNPGLTITQNNENVDFNINTVSNEVTLFLIEDDPVTIQIVNQELILEIASTFVEGECCSGIRVDNLKIDDSFICENEECDEVLRINLK